MNYFDTPNPADWTNEPRAAMRDASFWNRPGTGRRYHVIVEVPYPGADEPARVPGCNRNPDFVPNSMPLDLGAATPARMVYEVLRCQRAGCKKLWPDHAPNEHRQPAGA